MPTATDTTPKTSRRNTNRKTTDPAPTGAAADATSPVSPHEAPSAPESIWANTRFELCDPKTLVLANNSRTIGDIAKERPDLCKSVAANGVLVPLIANPGPDGRPAVRDGFSRALAALRAPKTNPTVPVLITESADAEDWTRIREQFVINHVREGYSEANKAAVYEQMSMFGFGAEEIADRLGGGTTAEVVRAGLTVRANAAAKNTLEQHPQLTLEQAAAMVEFEDDDEASESLQTTLKGEPEQFDHQVARLRRQRAYAQAREALVAQLTERGVRIVHRSWGDPQQNDLRDLRRSREDDTLLGDDPSAHADCPGHAAYIASYGDAPEAIYLCTEWKKQRHVDRYGSAGAAGPKTETEKAEMRTVRKNNADWRAAEDVRRAFLRKLVTRKTPPKRAQHFLTAALLADQGAVEKALRVSHPGVHTLFGDLPAIKDRQAMLTKLGRASSNDAVMMQLTAVLAAYEASTDKDTWRRATADHQRYFAALQAWGYTLSPVEQLVLDATVLGSAHTEAVTGSAAPPNSARAKRGKRDRSDATPEAQAADSPAAEPTLPAAA